MKNTAHPVDRTANWCSHGGWFTLAQLHYTNWNRILNIQKLVSRGWPLHAMGVQYWWSHHHYWKENPVNVYKKGWQYIHNKYNACQSKYKHKRGKPKQ
jgi:hypothetical protein